METREQLGPYGLTQSDDCFKLGRDSLALAHFASLRPGWRVWDLGTGTGVLLLLLLAREPALTVTGLELDGGAAALARRNLSENGLSGTIVQGNLVDLERLPPGACDLVLSNPPYFALGTGLSGGRARMEEACTLPSLCAAASRLTKNGGRFALVYRPERLAELFSALCAVGLEPKRLQLLHHSPQKPPFAVLVEAVHQGRPGLAVLPPLFSAPGAPDVPNAPDAGGTAG